jgi:hypothetical protein
LLFFSCLLLRFYLFYFFSNWSLLH